MERYGFHIIISIQASDALIMKTRTGGRAVDRSMLAVQVDAGESCVLVGNVARQGHYS